MSKRKMPVEHKLILLFARLEINNPAQQEIRKILSYSINWNKVLELSNRHQILPFFYYNIKKLGLQNIIPRAIFSEMENCYFSNTFRILMLEKEISCILGLANLKAIVIIPFRGFSLSQTLYFNSGLRIMSDIDILIKKSDFQEIRNVLTHLGYEESVIEPSHKFFDKDITTFSKKLSPSQHIVIDAHFTIVPARPYEIKLPCLWERTQEGNLNNQKIFYLSSEDAFLSLVLHLRRHIRPCRLVLKLIVDISELLNINADKLDWLYIKDSARNNHIISPVYLSLYLAKNLFNTTVSEGILGEFTPNIFKCALLHLTINRYNFFSLKQWQGIFLRFLLLDNPIDFLLYLWRVSFLERFIARQRFKKEQRRHS